MWMLDYQSLFYRILHELVRHAFSRCCLFIRLKTALSHYLSNLLMLSYSHHPQYSPHQLIIHLPSPPPSSHPSSHSFYTSHLPLPSSPPAPSLIFTSLSLSHLPLLSLYHLHLPSSSPIFTSLSLSHLHLPSSPPIFPSSPSPRRRLSSIRW